MSSSHSAENMVFGSFTAVLPPRRAAPPDGRSHLWNDFCFYLVL